MVAKRRKLRRSGKAVRSLPALVVGLGLLGLGGMLWLMLARASVSQDLLSKLPKNSRIAGVARLDSFDYQTLRLVSQSAKIYPRQTKTILDTVQGAATPDLLRRAMGDEIAFAETGGQALAVVTVRNEASYAQLTATLAGRLADRVQAPVDIANRGRVQIASGRLPNAKRPVFFLRDGGHVYLATDPGTVADTLTRRQGFDSRRHFAAVSDSLPGAQDAYVFLNGTLSESDPRLDFSLIGLAVRNDTDELKIEAASARPPRLSVTLPRGSGELLPAVRDASISLGGRSPNDFLKLLEAGRAEKDLPAVLRFQNSLSRLDQRLGTDIQSEYLGTADRYVYARSGTKQKPAWMGLLEYETPEVAKTKVDSLTALVKQRLRVPVRREVVRILPDGTKSREIESEKNELLDVDAIRIAGQAGYRARLPELGTVIWQVRDRYFLIGSSEPAVTKLAETVRNPSPADASGQLILRLKLARADVVTGAKDGIFDWIISARPERGSFTLDKKTGELIGGVTFAER